MVESFDNCVPQPFLVALIWRTALLRGRLNLEVRLYLHLWMMRKITTTSHLPTVATLLGAQIFLSFTSCSMKLLLALRRG